MIFFLLWNKKIYFEGMDVFVHTMKVNGVQNIYFHCMFHFFCFFFWNMQ